MYAFSSDWATEVLYDRALGSVRWRWTYGGRGGGKSVEIARALVLLGAIEPMIILCAREFQNSINDSVLALLEAQIIDLGLSHFYKVKNNEIEGRNGTRFTFKGLRNNIQSIKSMHGIKICWVEEAQTVSQDSWDILGPTVRANKSEVWVSFNPREEEDPTYKLMTRHQEDPPDGGVIIRKVNYCDNAFFPDVLRQEMEYCIRSPLGRVRAALQIILPFPKRGDSMTYKQRNIKVEFQLVDGKTFDDSGNNILTIENARAYVNIAAWGGISGTQITLQIWGLTTSQMATLSYRGIWIGSAKFNLMRVWADGNAIFEGFISDAYADFNQLPDAPDDNSQCDVWPKNKGS
ncbi:PBSX family phage terminase large subunit [Photorhabdus aballayi]|uniref:PBSX family phage terminase large subunit n=1 Tax=Photorhabdus aballayi TaxID=2991723 RepID=UPI0024B4BACE|nr:PBSX family phage terminase large subunit [Photorhabdus aballayi]